jgi:hypothetical protein
MNQNLMTQNKSVTGEFQESKELSEIKGKMFLARQFPRDENWALQRALKECERADLAASAQYEYPKGDAVVKGPSIRLVEVLGRHWGNIMSGVTEVDATDGSTLIKAFAWDLETNVSDEKTFAVKHERSTKAGTKRLTDERDIYEMVANKGARRKRACLLAVIPGWFVDAAITACEETLKKSLTAGKTIEEVREAIVAAFAEFSITPQQITDKIGKDVKTLSQNDIVKLRHLYSAIKDGFVKASEAFGIPDNSKSGNVLSEEDEAALGELNKKLGKGGSVTGNAADKG